MRFTRRDANSLALRLRAGIVSAMHPREKASLYHELGRLVHGGTPFPKAIEKLATFTRGSGGTALAAIKAALNRGATVGESLAAGAPLIAPLDAGVFAAGDRAGRLDSSLEHVSEYYAAIAEARARMWNRMAYPLFVLHFAFVALSLPLVFAPDGGIDAFLRLLGMAVGGLWLAIFGGGAVIRALHGAAGRSAPLDRLLRAIPVFGKLRRAFALSRFCTAYHLQLEAGVNVLGSLDIAGTASGSAVLCGAVARGMPAVRSGGKVGAALAETGAFPEPFIRAFTVGEETGELDLELNRIGETYRIAAMKRLETIAEWVPRLLYIAILCYIAWRIVGFYVGRMSEMQQMLKE
jgi:type II secretory pathway component PulF